MSRFVKIYRKDVIEKLYEERERLYSEYTIGVRRLYKLIPTKEFRTKFVVANANLDVIVLIDGVRKYANYMSNRSEILCKLDEIIFTIKDIVSRLGQTDKYIRMIQHMKNVDPNKKDVNVSISYDEMFELYNIGRIDALKKCGKTDEEIAEHLSLNVAEIGRLKSKWNKSACNILLDHIKGGLQEWK